jgi:phytoene dehydrogenase-like protein
VVGAGVAGLRCALALADAGLRVTVLEASPHAGGRAASWADETTGQQVDIGPHVVSSEHRNFMAMLSRLGTADQIQWQRSPLITLVDGEGTLRMPRAFGPAPFHGLMLLPQALRRLSMADGCRTCGWRGGGARERGAAARPRPGGRPRLAAVAGRAAARDRLVLALGHAGAAERAAGALLGRRADARLPADAGRSGWHFGFPKVGLSQLYVPGSCRAVLRSGGQVLFGARVQKVLVQEGRLAGLEMADGRPMPPRAACWRCRRRSSRR